MSSYKAQEDEKKVIRARLKGAQLTERPYRGMMWKLLDGTYLSLIEYKLLRHQCGVWWLM